MSLRKLGELIGFGGVSNLNYPTGRQTTLPCWKQACRRRQSQEPPLHLTSRGNLRGPVCHPRQSLGLASFVPEAAARAKDMPMAWMGLRRGFMGAWLLDLGLAALQFWLLLGSGQVKLPAISKSLRLKSQADLI